MTRSPHVLTRAHTHTIIQVWLRGIPPSIATANRRLTPVASSVARTTGVDAQGTFEAVSITWVSDGGHTAATTGHTERRRGVNQRDKRLPVPTAVHVVTEWAVYADSNNMLPRVRFTQRYPNGVQNASAVAVLPKGVPPTGECMISRYALFC